MDKKYETILFLVLVILLNTKDGVQGLHIRSVNVPDVMIAGEVAWLECEFIDEGDSIYSLKWYLGLDEFYRWTPAETPPVKIFPVRDNPLQVDEKASSRGRVKIYQVTLDATGVYRCEVSAEAPSFHTESAVASMNIVDLPDTKPQIRGAEINYQLHEEVSLNCTSPRSQPPATLTFYVNDEQAEPSWLLPYQVIEEYGTGLETSVLGLRFPLKPRLLRRGAVIVKCTAAISNLYWESSEALIPGDLPYHASIMEGRASAATSLPSVQGCLVLLLFAKILRVI
ncbi:cell adhesion molecule 3-like isoform X2 [Palaemon carinicauda]|uniref:cell adhesion molecule 3-like isoform X2 n=1 Tax=Palaemon carinicauda TaxID=392227 RepID=UPI0035B654C4